MKRILKIIMLSALVLLVYGSTSAQDAQYSQAFANPLYLNPALTGSHSGSYRVISNYRSQWNGAIEKPFRNIAFGGDVKFDIGGNGGRMQGGDKVAVGAQIYSDRIALIDYNTTQLSLLGAFHKLLDEETNQYLSVGLQVGLSQRGINYENLTFQDEFNGVDRYNLPTREILPSNSVVSPDISLGLHYTISPSRGTSYYIGGAYHHANRPNISLFDQEDVRDEYKAMRLPQKYTLHASASYAINYQTAIEPRVMYASQGEHQSATIGANLRYNVPDSEEVSTHLGLWLRASEGLTTWTSSDVIISAGYGRKGLLVGLSYDANLLGFSNSIFGNNTLELSVSFTGWHDNDSMICPSF